MNIKQFFGFIFFAVTAILVPSVNVMAQGDPVQNFPARQYPTTTNPSQQYPAQPHEYDNTYVSYNDFYTELAPYGQWIEDPNYGYVWLPDVDNSFRPYYTNGYWAMTEYGNTWVSEYPWGWACFHYGRWTFDTYYGWIWIPGTTWGPAWVCWRNGFGYFGWAPLGPNYEFTSGDYTCPNDWWVFIPPQYIYTGNYYRYWNGPHGNKSIIQNTEFINNNYVVNNHTYVSGPQQSQIQQIAKVNVTVYHLDNSDSRTTYVHQGVVKMYKPSEIKPQPIDGSRIIPPNVISAPRPVNSKPQAVNTHAGAQSSFTNEYVTPKAIPEVTPVKPAATPVASQKNETQHRADNYEYKTTIPATDPHIDNTPAEQPRQVAPVKPQGAQQPEPVQYEPQHSNHIFPAQQHLEPIPYQPAPKTPVQPAPTQKPENVKPGGKK